MINETTQTTLTIVLHNRTYTLYGYNPCNNYIK